MSGMDWATLNHDLFVHVPVAAAILLPAALMAAQRPGRGIKPWWTTCRYLAWTGVLGGGLAVASGFRAARASRLLDAGAWLLKGSFRDPSPLQVHQWAGLASLVLGALLLRSLHRKRLDHQGIGILGLLLGLLWAGATLVAGFSGIRPGQPVLPEPRASRAVPGTSGPAEPEAGAPLRALDYGSLVPLHPAPVKSAPHGNRWIRVWVSPEGEGAYREGRPLPAGAMVVMSTVEDRWGRPGYEQGPLYAMEVMPGGRPAFTFYWPRVPEARRDETQGAERVYWRGNDSHLAGCLACHGNGIAALKDRSTWGIPRRKTRPESGEAPGAGPETKVPFSPQ